MPYDNIDPGSINEWPLYQVLQTILSKTWEFFQLQVPGAPFTFGQMVTGTMIILVSLNIIGHSFGVGDGNQNDFTGFGTFFGSGKGETGRVKPHFTRK